MNGDIPDDHPAMVVLKAAVQGAFAAAKLYSEQHAEWRELDAGHSWAARHAVEKFVRDELERGEYFESERHWSRDA